MYLNLGLRFLVRICQDLGLREGNEYSTKLARAEKNLVRTGSGSVSERTSEVTKPETSLNSSIIQDSVNKNLVAQAVITQKKDPEISFEEDVFGLLPE